MPFGQWEWQDDKGVWNPYEHSDNILVEGGFRTGSGKMETKDLSFNKGYDSNYVFDYAAMTQHNTESGRIRKLRRHEVKEDDDDMGFVRTVSAVGGGMKPTDSGPVFVGKPVKESEELPPTPPLKPEAPPKTSPPPVAMSDDDDDEPPMKKPKPEAKKKPVVKNDDDDDDTPPAVAPPKSPAKPKTSESKPLTAGSIASMWGSKAPPAKPAVVVAVDDDDDDSAASDDDDDAKKTKPPPKPASMHVAAVDAALVADQESKGAQSKRHQKYDLGPVGKDPHGKYCFDRMLSREKQLCGEWAVFYHSYSFAALLYEVQAAVAAVLFRFKSEFATLPRLLKEAFNEIPDAEALQKEFPKFKDRDHNPKYRAVGISGTSSLLAADSEAPPKNIFLHGYSCADLSFVGALEGLLVACGVPAKDKATMAKKIIDLSAKYGLDVSQFKGPACKSGRAGHMLQIFMKRTLVNKYVYAALPFGVTDKKRPDLEKYLQGDGPIQGQVRLVTNPSIFMRGNAVRMYVFSADPTFHANRPKFQEELTALLQPVIGTPAVRKKAAEGIYAGKLPPWFNAEDFEEQQKKKAPPP